MVPRGLLVIQQAEDSIHGKTLPPADFTSSAMVTLYGGRGTDRMVNSTMELYGKQKKQPDLVNGWQTQPYQ